MCYIFYSAEIQLKKSFKKSCFCHITYITTLTVIQKLLQKMWMLVGNPAEYSAVKNWHFTSAECLYMCVRKPTSCTVELYMTPVKMRKWLFSVFQFPCSSGWPCSSPHCRETEDHRVSFFLHLCHSHSLLSYFNTFAPSFAPLHLSFIPLLFSLIS